MPATTQFDTDSVILERIVAGDELAFKVFYDQNFVRIAKFTFKMCKSESITEEIVQDVFLKLWLNRDALADVTHIQGYLFSMARNKTIDFLRKLAKETHIIETLSTQLTESHYAIDDKLDEDSLLLLINDALNGLCIQKRKIFEMSKIQGFSHDEIAETLHLSKSTIKNHLSETLKHLKKYIINNPRNGFFIIIYYLQAIYFKN